MKTRVQLVAYLAALYVIGGSVAPALAQPVTLRYRWTKGEELRYRFTQQGSSTLSGVPGMNEMTIDQTMSQVFKTVVDDIAADGTATLRQVYESVRVEVNSPMGKLVYDSAAADPGKAEPMVAMMAGILQAMVGESVTVVLSPTGAVQRVEGMSRIVEKMFKTLPPDSNPAAAGMMNNLKAGFSDEAMRGMFAQGFAQFPERPVKPGEAWTSQFTFSNPMIGALKTTIASTLKGVETSIDGPMARIGSKLTITHDAAAGGTAPMGFKIQMEDSTGESELLFDVAKGRMVRATTRTTMPSSMTGPGPDGTPTTMHSLAKATITIELVQE